MKRRLLLCLGFLILALVSLICPAPAESILRRARDEALKRRGADPKP